MRSLQRSRRTIQTKVASTWAVVGLSRHLPRPTNTSNLTNRCTGEQDWPNKMCKYIWIQIQCTQMTWLLWCTFEQDMPIKGANTSKYKYTQPQYWLHLSARLIQQICLTMTVIRNRSLDLDQMQIQIKILRHAFASSKDDHDTQYQIWAGDPYLQTYISYTISYRKI